MGSIPQSALDDEEGKTSNLAFLGFYAELQIRSKIFRGRRVRSPSSLFRCGMVQFPSS